MSFTMLQSLVVLLACRTTATTNASAPPALAVTFGKTGLPSFAVSVGGETWFVNQGVMLTHMGATYYANNESVPVAQQLKVSGAKAIKGQGAWGLYTGQEVTFSTPTGSASMVAAVKS